jgi:hypothetical protein
MGKRACAVAVLLCAVTAAGCGNDDGPDLDPYIDAVAADIAKPDEGSPAIPKDKARCAAEKAIAAIDEDVITEFDTPEDLVAATTDDLTALDLDDATLDTIAEDFVGCLGGLDFYLDALADFGVPKEGIACVEDAVTDKDFIASVRADIAGETDEAFDEATGACFA